MYELGNVIRELSLTEVFSVETWDYEWDELTAWRAPSGRFYWYGDSGCSCTSFGENIRSAADLSDGDRDALERALREWCGSDHQKYIEGMEKLRQI